MRPIDAAFSLLKALPEHQMFRPAYSRENLAEKTYDDAGIDVGERQRGEGTIHPAIYGMLARLKEEGGYGVAGYGDLPNLNLDTYTPPRLSRSGHQYTRDPPEGLLEHHPEAYADSMPYGSKGDPTDQWNASQNPDNKRRTQAPQTSSYQRSHPTDEEVKNFTEDYSPYGQKIHRDTPLGRRAASLAKMGGGPNVAMMHDLPSYMEEALNQKKKTRGDSRKKKEKASKLRQLVDDHEEDAGVIDFYRQNHPEWFNSFRNGGGE